MQLGSQVHHHAALLRQIAPARPRQFHDLPNGAIQLDPLERQLGFALAIEFAHARHGPGHILDGTLNGGQVAARALAEIRFALEQRFGVQRNRRNRVVDVVGDTAGHLPERPQSLLLHDGVLALPQVVVRLLQGAVQPRLMAGQGDVLAELPQELALAAAEGLLMAARAYQHPEYLVLHDQRRNHHGAQPRCRQPLRKRKGHLQHVRFVDQLPRHASGQPVGVERHIHSFRQTELLGEDCAGDAERADGQRLRDGVMQEKAAKIDRQVLLQAAEHDLKDARQILAFSRGARDVLQQAQAAELGVQLALGLLNLREHLIEGVGEQVEFVGARSGRAHRVVVTLGYRPGGLRERQDRLQQLVLQAARNQIGQRQGDADHQQNDQRVQLRARVHSAEVRFHEQRAQLPRALRDRLKTDQRRASEGVARRARPGRKARCGQSLRIGRKHLALRIVQRRRDDVRVGLECRQHPGGVIGIVEGQRGRAVAGDRLAQYLQLLDAGLAEGQELVRAERRGGHGEHRAHREKNHPHQRAANRRGGGGHASILGARADDVGGPQQLRADREAGRASRFDVDAQPNAIVLRRELNHDAVLRSAVEVGHGKRAAVRQGRENLRQLRALGAVDVQNLTVADFIDAVKAPHQQRMFADLLAVHRLVQMCSEGIVAQDADDEGRIGRGECLGRPFHEVREVVNEDGLDLVFGGRFRGARGAQA